MLKALVFAPCFVSSVAFADTDSYAHAGALRGKGYSTWSAGLGFISKRSEHIGIGFGHFNEGHLPDNHRDGFYAQGWYLQPIGRNFELQVGTGPYASMNNTTVDGVRKNDFQMGLLTSAVLKWRPGASPWYLRLQYNHVLMTPTYDTNSVLLGVGRDFDSKESDLFNGYSRTTQVGPQESAVAYELEVKFPVVSFDHLAYSVGFLWEGDTILQDRKGTDSPVVRQARH